MDVVLYMRYSSDKQTEQSIEGQERVCSEFCKQNGYNIVDRYIDRATSAFKNTDKRTDFQRMIKDSEKKSFQAVVVYKLDRFSRNRYDSATYKSRLKKNGVRVISATENISDNPEGVILESVLEGMAEFYSKELSQKISRGLRESALKGKNIGGVVPLGYKIHNHKLVIDPVGANVVKEAFSLYADGTPVSEMVKIFNEKGYRTAKKAKFNKNSFHSILINERYTGLYKYRDIEIENGIPAIVDKETFDRVQHKLKSSAKAHAKSRAIDYLLTQKLFCGHCGSPMIGESGRSHTGQMYYYYACVGHKRKHICDSKSIKKDWLEDLVAKETMSLLTPEIIDRLAEGAVKVAEEERKNNTVIPHIKNEILSVDEKIENLIKFIENGADSPTLFNRLKELEKLKKDYQKQLEEASKDIIVLEKEHIIWWLEKFIDGDITDPLFKRNLIDLLVNSVTVWQNNETEQYTITMGFNLNGKQTRTVKGSFFNGKLPPSKPWNS